MPKSEYNPNLRHIRPLGSESRKSGPSCYFFGSYSEHEHECEEYVDFVEEPGYCQFCSAAGLGAKSSAAGLRRYFDKGKQAAMFAYGSYMLLATPGTGKTGVACYYHDPTPKSTYKGIYAGIRVLRTKADYQQLALLPLLDYDDPTEPTKNQEQLQFEQALTRFHALIDKSLTEGLSEDESSELSHLKQQLELDEQADSEQSYAEQNLWTKLDKATTVLAELNQTLQRLIDDKQ